MKVLTSGRKNAEVVFFTLSVLCLMVYSVKYAQGVIHYLCCMFIPT